MPMLGIYRLAKGRFLHARYMAYFTALRRPGLIGWWLRLWRREVTVPAFAYDLGDEVQIKSLNRIGMVMYRWPQGRARLYELKIGRFNYVFPERDLRPTRFRTAARVEITEIRSKKLSDGAVCWTMFPHWMVRTFSMPYARSATKLRSTSSSASSAVIALNKPDIA